LQATSVLQYHLGMGIQNSIPLLPLSVVKMDHFSFLRISRP
jgi:hypothetical protein